ncbi:MAG: flagellin [Propionivibrio sp.]|uniref:flagellin N-terminal helical domain-containing protein n=1 Tax=Propionivibrio sp. TaxID=2212460 RepID=UPI0025DE8F3A|nr:flagellin [Propionivibrio sp.]MBK8893228.1 flagellin [Propionivibrio sp.]
MPQVINTNISSLNAQRNLNMSQTALSVSLQRLSSGLRINSAKDDAAGLAISERFTTQIRGLNQAIRNANDGVSLAQTGEGALAEVTSNLQRIRELAVQSANATNSSSDRAALDLEVQQRLAEIDRTATQTSFNSQKILDGTFGSATFQVGANVGETISIGLSTSMRTNALGALATGTSSAEVTVAALTGAGTIKVGTGATTTIAASTIGTQNGQSVGSAYAKALAINAAAVPGLTATATNNVEFTLATVGGSATDTYSLMINGVAIYAAATDASTAITAQQITDAINANQSTTGVTAALSGSDLRLTAADGRDIAVGQDITVGPAAGIAAGAGGSSTVNGVVYRDGTLGTVAQAGNNSATAAAVNGGTLTLSALEDITITGDGLIMGFAAATTTIAKDAVTISSANVLSVTAANNTIQRIDSALSAVSALRSTFGAIQNRFESVTSSLSATSENLSAARSRIQDTDFAQETANLTRAQILQQSGIAMLGQANALPNNVLSLLRG